MRYTEGAEVITRKKLELPRQGRSQAGAWQGEERLPIHRKGRNLAITISVKSFYA
jgi:hypothetical protein